LDREDALDDEFFL